MWCITAMSCFVWLRSFFDQHFHLIIMNDWIFSELQIWLSTYETNQSLSYGTIFINSTHLVCYLYSFFLSRNKRASNDENVSHFLPSSLNIKPFKIHYQRTNYIESCIEISHFRVSGICETKLHVPMPSIKKCYKPLF